MESLDLDGGAALGGADLKFYCEVRALATVAVVAVAGGEQWASCFRVARCSC
jgi:hypothetical protein